METWKQIEGFENQYCVSDIGNVKSLKREILIRGKYKGIIKEKILSPSFRGKGYLSVKLGNKSYSIHRLVICTFKNVQYKNELHVNHINEIKTDNRLSNLEFCDNKYNSNYGSKPSKISNSLTRKSVIQLTLNGEIIKLWANGEYAMKSGYNSSHISKCCRGIRQTHAGCRWEYSKHKVIHSLFSN